MKKITELLKNNYLIITIVLLAFSFRWYGIYFDYPRTNFIWDETYDMSYLMNLLDERKILSDNFTSSYPALLPILYLPVTILRIIYIAIMNGLDSMSAFKNHVIEYGMGEIYIVSRWYAVVFGVATVLLIYKIYSCILKNKLSAHYAAIVYSFSLLPVFLSHWGKHHSVMVFFFTLSLFFILKFEQDKKQKYFYWSVIAATLSFSTHYIGISAVIFPFCGFIFNRRILSLRTVLKGFGLYSGTALFFYLFNYKGVVWMFKEMNANYYGANNYGGIVPTGTLERFYYVFRDSFFVDPIFTTLFIFLVVFGIKKLVKNNLTRYIIAGLAFNYFLMVTVIVGPKMTRWLLVFVTLSTPLVAGYFAEYLLVRNIKKIIIYFLLVLVLIPNMFFSVRWLLLLRNNTYIEAGTWIENNVSIDQIIYSFDNVLDVPLSYESAMWNKEFNKMITLKKINYIIENKDYFKSKGVNLMYDKNNDRYEKLSGEETDYIVITYGKSADKKTILNNLQKYHKIELIKYFYPTNNERLAERGLEEQLNNPSNLIDLLYLDKSGPFVEIYKII